MTDFKLTAEDVDRIKAFEGLRLTAYKATAWERYYTIGYGHCGRDVRKGMAITEAQAKDLLAKDLVALEAGVNELGVCKTHGQYVALVDFTFNLGMGSLRKSTLLRYIRQGKTNLLVVREFMRWIYSGGKVLDGLVKRRRWEAETFIDGKIHKSDTDLRWYIDKS